MIDKMLLGDIFKASIEEELRNEINKVNIEELFNKALSRTLAIIASRVRINIEQSTEDMGITVKMVIEEVKR